MPGIKITDEDRKRIDAKFICTLCRLLLYIPMQTMCGHLMCLSCIENLLGSSNPKCPEDGYELSKEKVFPDVFTKRELKGVHLHCANSGCEWHGAYEKLEEHVDSSCEGVPVVCKHCGEEVMRKEVEKHGKQLCPKAPVMCDYQDIGCNHNQTMKREQLDRHLNEGLPNHMLLLKKHALDRISSLFKQHFVLVKKVTSLERKVDVQRSQQAIIHSYNGILLWKIENYQKKRQDAINGVKTALYSPPFYSAQFGFKMCGKIYMNGDGFGKGTHLSLFFVVMRGDYDALQTWPFQKKITMMLLDQGNGDHMIDAFHSDPQSSSFQRPKSDMNIASGSPLVMPLDSLNKRQYIKDDVMFIKIIVE